MNVGERLALALQSMTAGTSSRDMHQVLGDRHARHQREVLVDHADAERLRVLRAGDRRLAAVDA